MIDVRLRPDVRLMVGASGSGKSSWLKAAIANRPRVLIFDPEGEYTGHVAKGAAHAFDLTAERAFRVRVIPPVDQWHRAHAFKWFCLLALQRGPCIAAVDELHLVTDAWRPPSEWVGLVTRGRKHAVGIYAAAPRLTVVDKTLENGLSSLRVGRLNHDRQRAAQLLGVPVADVDSLAGTDFIERDMTDGTVTKGTMWPARRKSRPTDRPKSA
jgi:hypothetical protein